MREVKCLESNLYVELDHLLIGYQNKGSIIVVEGSLHNIFDNGDTTENKCWVALPTKAYEAEIKKFKSWKKDMNINKGLGLGAGVGFYYIEDFTHVIDNKGEQVIPKDIVGIDDNDDPIYENLNFFYTDKMNIELEIG